MVTKEDLKQEIEQLDSSYLELVFKLLKQFPHHHRTTPDALSSSRAIDYADDFSTFSGILKDSPNFNSDPVEIQRGMRDEWN